jgi:hypothetical protein
VVARVAMFGGIKGRIVGERHGEDLSLFVETESRPASQMPGDRGTLQFRK